MKPTILFLLLLAGCATLSRDVDGARLSWQGARYEEVVARWGVPARHTKFDDGRYVYTWDSERTTSSGGFMPSISIFGGSGVGAGGSAGYDRVRCERTLIFREGVVTEQTWLGPSTYCSTFKRD